jgi:hypothetical protein
MDTSTKKLNEMNRLSDMAHFPAAVNAGATANILLTLVITWWLVPRYPQVYAPMVWSAIVLCLNLLPVVLLRLTLKPDDPCRTLATMDFFKDQHRFSDWVYLAASANMAFWIMAAWAIFSVSHTPETLVAILFVALVVTFSPVLFRHVRSHASAR